MRYYTTSAELIKNTEHFFKIKKYYFFTHIKPDTVFVGWGRKRSGKRAERLAQKYQKPFLLLEDGFVRSVRLGVDGAKSFSIVEDDLGIYYDATAPSKLENLLKEYDFKSDRRLMKKANKAIANIKKYKISKYNLTSLQLPNYLKSEGMKVLIVGQTGGDASLTYGMATTDTTAMIKDAQQDYPNAEIYVKVHPDVLSGKKSSNIDMAYAQQHCSLIVENINPLVLLDAFDVVYTQTSQMGFEALLLGKRLHLYGMPFYAGWNIPNITMALQQTKIENVMQRRDRTLTIEEVFAGAYILYTRYAHPNDKREIDILETIDLIKAQRDINEVEI